MAQKPTYKELEQKVKELEKKVAEREMSKQELLQERDLFLKGPVVVFKWAAKENWPAEYVSPNMEPWLPAAGRASGICFTQHGTIWLQNR